MVKSETWWQFKVSSSATVVKRREGLGSRLLLTECLQDGCWKAFSLLQCLPSPLLIASFHLDSLRPRKFFSNAPAIFIVPLTFLPCDLGLWSSLRSSWDSSNGFSKLASHFKPKRFDRLESNFPIFLV